MKKFLLYISILIMISGCGKKVASNDNLISEITESIMLEKNSLGEKQLAQEEIKNNENEEITETKEEVVNSVNDNLKYSEPTTKKADKIIQDDEVNLEAFDYQIHKGRIDCLTTSECVDISLPIQFELKNAIDSVFYLEVKASNDKSLGYFIKYIFKDYQYEDYDTCISKGNYLKEVLTDRIIDYKCSDEGILEVETDYENDSVE